MNTYKIDKNIAAKNVRIFVGDKMTVTEAENFMRDFKQTVASIKASDFELIIDSVKMNVLTQELTDKLTQTMSIYKQAGFKKIIIEIQNNAVLKMQVSRVMRQAGLTDAEVVTR